MSNISLSTKFYGNTLLEYIIVIAILLFVLTATTLLKRVVGNIASRLLKKTSSRSLSYILTSAEKLSPILQYIPFYLSVKLLVLPASLEHFISIAGTIIITICCTRLISDIINLISNQHFIGNNNPILKNITDFFADIIIWIIAILFILSNLGFNINTLLAGIGIGGMAIAFASQALLSDLFNYFTILFDKPFVVGDDVHINGNYGNVQKIGLKGTRLMSNEGEQIIISNTDMTKNVLKNYRIMEKRRKTSVLGIRYDTPAAILKEIPAILKNIVENTTNTEFLRVHFSEFADSSLNFTLVYYVRSKNYTIYMDKVQEINFKILDAFASKKIDFAFPSKSLYIEKQDIQK
jgi:small-conductance mechanosensitive channel